MLFVIILIALAIVVLIYLVIKSPVSKEIQRRHTQHNATIHNHLSNSSAQIPAKKVFYRCPMHPQYISEQPGQCPICGMDLVRVEEETSLSPSASTGEHEHSIQQTPVGMGMVSLSEEKIHLIGVKTMPAKFEQIEKIVRVPAVISYDERKVSKIQSKVQGWVEKLYVNFTGQFVKKGDPLLEVYSPDLVSAQEEYLLALKNYNSLQSADEAIRQGALALLDASRRRIRYWDISEEQINKLENENKPFKTITLHSRVGGYVIQKNVQQGMEIMPGMDLYTVIDLSLIWAIAGVQEIDIRFVKKGMEAVFVSNVYPDRKFVGKVTFIDPYLKPETKTVGVRLEIPNPHLELKPHMTGEVLISVILEPAIIVPSSAIMDSGDKRVVFVETSRGHFMPREVKLGARTADYVQVLSGLEEGELVVVNGNFLLDSESRLKAETGIGAGAHQH
mgnify:CR=1 FL=1